MKVRHVNTFWSSQYNSQLRVGPESGIAVGPVGRTAGVHNTNINELEPAYTYSFSKGLFVGVSMEGSVLTVRHDINQELYGVPFNVRTALEGGVPRPREADQLYTTLEKVIAMKPLYDQHDEHTEQHRRTHQQHSAMHNRSMPLVSTVPAHFNFDTTRTL